jgi:glycosyltransferase involved in cell wall biosynthesis
MANNGKKTILFMTDLADTGFGRVGQEIVKRFALSGMYNVVYLGWVARNPAVVEKWKELGVVVQMCDGSIEDQFAQKTLPRAIEHYQPDLIWTLGDPWMVDHVSKMPGYGQDWRWISYVPIDRDELNKSWLPALKAPDALVLYSHFGAEVVKRHLPRVQTEVIYHGVDTDVFRPMDKAACKQALGIDPSTFIFGFVGRNQIRKRIPRFMRAFHFWNCQRYQENAEIKVRNDGHDELWNARDYARQVCHMRPEHYMRGGHFRQLPDRANSAVYLHTTKGYTDQNDGLWVGWNLNEYSTRFNLDDNVMGKPSRTMLPSEKSMANIEHYLPDEHLAKLYNIIDVHVMPSCREGFGLPIIEAASSGLPSIVTGYSSMPELVADGRGMSVPPSDFDDEPFFDAPSALVDIAGLVEAMNQAVAEHASGAWAERQKTCRAWAVEHTWDKKFGEFHKLVKEVMI